MTDRLRTALLFGAIGIAWLWFIPYFPELNPPNEGVRVYMTVAIVEDGTFAINDVMRRWGYVNDKAKACTTPAEPLHKLADCPRGPAGKGCKCRLYSSKAPLASLLGVPVHALNVLAHRLAGAGAPSRFSAFYVLRLFGAILPGLLGVWLFWAALGRLDVRRFAREATTAGFALGSMHYTYSCQLVSHAQAGMALFAACLAIEAARARPDPRDWRGALLAAAAGCATAATPGFEYPAALAALALGVFALWRLRPVLRFVPYALGAALPVGLVALYHARAFGSPFATGYAFLENDLFDKMMAPGFHGVHLPTVRGAAEALAVSLFSLPTGLFVFSPFLALGAVGLWRAFRGGEPAHGRPLAAASLAVVLLMLAFLASLAIWRGGWQVGPRYIAAVVPFLAFYAAVGAERLMRAWPVYGSGLYAALVVVALALTGLPTWIYPHLPETFVNPVFDLVVPLVRRGFVPLTLASVAGVYGPAALVPGAAAVVALAGWLCAGPPAARPARLTHAAVATLLVVLTLVTLSQIHLGGPDTARMTDRVTEKWYPPPAAMSLTAPANLVGAHPPAHAR